MEGDLRDVSLAALIQLFCEKGAQAEIVLDAGGKIGRLYLGDGNIVHACVGPTRGEEAFFQLLAWEDGSFEIHNGVESPERTIHSRAVRLLMEGLRVVEKRAVEKRVRTLRAEVTADEELRQDGELEDRLIALLSALEQLTVRLEAKKVRRRPVQVLEILSEQLERTSALWRDLPGNQKQTSPLKDLLARTQEKIPEALMLEAVGDHLITDNIRRLDRPSPNGIEVDTGNGTKVRADNDNGGQATSGGNGDHPVCRACAAILELVDGYLDLVVHHFHRAENRETWSETCTLFVREARRNLDQVAFE